MDGAWQVQASTPWGVLSYRLAIAGRHNVKNSLAAAACALAAGVSTQIDNARLDNGVAKAKLQLRVSSGVR